MEFEFQLKFLGSDFMNGKVAL